MPLSIFTYINSLPFILIQFIIGSFWDQTLRYDCNRRLFEDEEQDLFRYAVSYSYFFFVSIFVDVSIFFYRLLIYRDLQSLPKNAALRKLNDLIKRARLAKVHAYIISELRNEMPAMFGKESKKKDLIKNIGNIYDRLQREHQISPGDFPDIKKMQEVLQNQDFTKFHSLKPQLLETVDRMLAVDIAKLMGMIPQEEVEFVSEPLIKGKFNLHVLCRLWMNSLCCKSNF